MKNLLPTSNSNNPRSNIIIPHNQLEPKTPQYQQQGGEEEEEAEEEEGARCEWDITLSTVVSSNTSRGLLSDSLGVVEFDPTGRLLATGGIARKIRIYNLNSLLSSSSTGNIAHLDNASAGADYYICTPAKLSSVKWRPGSGGRVFGSGDYDGVVMEYDLETKVPIFERDEHGGRRVWSVDYSHCGDPILGASGSDDGSMQLWDPRCEGEDCIAMVWPSKTASSSEVSSVCCVEFNPLGGWMVGVGCADKRAYVYDMRMLVSPVNVLEGHNKTVTYVRFLDNLSLVSSSVDGYLKLWDLEGSKGQAMRTYKGHVNSRNFVGLSVWREGGLLGCGSESNHVFVYDKRWGEPIWVQGFGVMDAGCGAPDDQHGFVSSVCWRQVEGEEEDRCLLVAGGSDGVLQVFQGKRK